jgi:hypothetical protein
MDSGAASYRPKEDTEAFGARIEIICAGSVGQADVLTMCIMKRLLRDWDWVGRRASLDTQRRSACFPNPEARIAYRESEAARSRICRAVGR